MVHTVSEYIGVTKTLEGDTLLSFVVPETTLTEYLENLEGQKVVLDIKKYNEKRSLNANAYLWKLCTLIAERIDSDKDSVYRLQLSKYGQFEDVTCKAEALDKVKSLFKYYEVFIDDYLGANEYVTIRGYFGSSGYDSKEMATLIDGTVRDCKDLGIETWSKDEIDRLISEWESYGQGNKSKSP